MKIDNELASEISSVMKLEFSTVELDSLTSEINNTLSILEMLEEVDTEDIEGTFHGVVGRETKLRADEAIQDETEVQTILSQANTDDNNLIEVPAMLDDGEGGA